MVETLDGAILVIKQGVASVNAILDTLNRQEALAIERTTVAERAANAVESRLADLREKALQANLNLEAANAAVAQAEVDAKEKAAFIVSAAKDESARIIDDARASANVVFAEIESNRAALSELEAKVAASQKEWGNLKLQLAQARENFLKAAS